MTDKPPPMTRAERRATGVVVALFLAVSTVFVVDSTWVLAKGAFQLDLEASPTDSAEARACFGQIRRLEAEVEQAVARSAAVKPEQAAKTYTGALGESFAPPVLAKLESSCSQIPRGMVALSSLLRIERAEAAAVAQHAEELGPIRADLHRALPPP